MSIFATKLHDWRIRNDNGQGQLRKKQTSYNKRQFYDRILTTMRSWDHRLHLYKKTYKLDEVFKRPPHRTTERNTTTRRSKSRRSVTIQLRSRTTRTSSLRNYSFRCVHSSPKDVLDSPTLFRSILASSE